MFKKLNYKKVKIFLPVIIVIFVIFFVGTAINAANLEDAFTAKLWRAAGKAGYDVGVISPNSLLGSIISTALSFLGVIFLILMIYGGYLWMTARGNEQQVEKAKSLINAAIIGLIIVLASYAISYFVLSEIGKETLEGIK